MCERRARASIRRLEVADLIEWSESGIKLPDHVADLSSMVGEVGQSPDSNDGFSAIKNSIGGGKGSVAIPRRMVRFLAAGARPALIATVLGLLLRCLSRRKAGWDGRGRVKASWIARTFAVSLRQVKAARRELLDLGWIEAEAGDQWPENRWGRAFRIDLAWAAPDSGGKAGGIPPITGATSAPLPAIPGATSAPPDLHQEPSLTGGSRNQEPVPGRTGFSIEGQGKKDQPPADLPTPKLSDVRVEDLKDTGRLLDLLGQAVAKGLVSASEADRLRFVGAVEHALSIASNPAALFTWLVLNGCWRYITGADEDRARQRLRLHDLRPAGMSVNLTSGAAPGVRIESLPLASSSPVESGGLSEDARIVKAIREATIRAGIFRDPWPAFQARYPEWDRARWDRALQDLGLPVPGR